jgi:hypothetical protein
MILHKVLLSILLTLPEDWILKMITSSFSQHKLTVQSDCNGYFSVPICLSWGAQTFGQTLFWACLTVFLDEINI